MACPSLLFHMLVVSSSVFDPSRFSHASLLNLYRRSSVILFVAFRCLFGVTVIEILCDLVEEREFLI